MIQLLFIRVMQKEKRCMIWQLKKCKQYKEFAELYNISVYILSCVSCSFKVSVRDSVPQACKQVKCERFDILGLSLWRVFSCCIYKIFYKWNGMLNISGSRRMPIVLSFSRLGIILHIWQALILIILIPYIWNGVYCLWMVPWSCLPNMCIS